MAHARAMKILVPLCPANISLPCISTVRFVARASRRAASTVVSTFFSATTAIRLDVQREINALPPIFDGAVSAEVFTHTRQPEDRTLTETTATAYKFAGHLTNREPARPM